MKTRLPGVGEIERRSTIDRRRDWYESCAMIHGPEEKKKTQGSQRVIVRRFDLSSSTNWRVLRSLFPRPDVATFRTSKFSWKSMYSCRTVRLQRGDSEEKQSSGTFPVLITEA